MLKVSKYILFIALIVISTSCKNEITVGSWQIISNNNKFPEGPAWDSANQILYVSNCYGDWITKIKNDISDTLLCKQDSTFMKTNGMIFHPDGYLIACDFGLGAIIKISIDGNSEVIIPGYNGEKFNRPNDITFDTNRNIYFSDPKSYGSDKPDGRLFYYNFSKSELKLVQDSLCFPNGLGISPNNGRLYLSESAKNRIISFNINSDGTLSDKKIFVELPGGDPDGMNFDENGNLWVAHFGSGNVFVISKQAEIIMKIKTPGKKPSNIEFGGKNNSTLYLTEDETNSIYKSNTNVTGSIFN